MNRWRVALVEVLQSGLAGWPAHGFLTRLDHDGEPDPALVAPGGRLVLVNQVHSAIALAVDAPLRPDARPEADGLATATPGLVLGIVTADCAPVLLADAANGVVGAAHAGWRGAFAGVLEATVDAMVGLGAERGGIRAAIGPTIAAPSYEVDEAFRDRFLQADAFNHLFFDQGNPGHFHFDLPAYVNHRLAAAGIGAVADLGLDTYRDEVRFHSFRRATHRGEPTYGRQYSLISL